MSHSTETKNNVEGMLRKGYPLRRISDESGVPYATVYSWAKKWGVDFNSDSSKISNEVREAIYKDWRSGMKQKDVAEKYGVQRNTVMRIRKEFGEDTGIKYGKGHHLWNGGVIEYSGGYLAEKLTPDDPMISMAKSDRYVFQHRLVMARHLGRPLSPDETVHHINGNRQDNRIENLQLRQGRHGRGVRFVCCDCGSSNVLENML